VPDFALDWGAPWAYSAFMYEDVGGTFKNGMHGSRHILQQIFNYFLSFGKVRQFAKKHIDPLVEDKVSILYDRLDPTFVKDKIRNSIGVGQGKPLGVPECDFFIKERYFIAVQLIIGFPLSKNCFTLSSYSRFVFDGKVYGTSAYYCGMKRNNSIVQLKTGEILRIEYIIELERRCGGKREHSESALSCILPKHRLFSNGNLLVVGTLLKLLPVSPIYEPYANNINLTASVKKLDSVIAETSRRRLPVKACFPKDIIYKGILIRNTANDVFCVVNQIKFENS
jgi:hypothetical protein